MASAVTNKGKRAHIFIPKDTLRVKSDKIAALGGTVYLVRGTYEDALREARAFGQRAELTFFA